MKSWRTILVQKDFGSAQDCPHSHPLHCNSLPRPKPCAVVVVLIGCIALSTHITCGCDVSETQKASHCPAIVKRMMIYVAPPNTTHRLS